MLHSIFKIPAAVFYTSNSKWTSTFSFSNVCLDPEYEYTEYLKVTNVLRENADYCGSTVSVQIELKQQIYYFFIFSDIPSFHMVNMPLCTFPSALRPPWSLFWRGCNLTLMCCEWETWARIKTAAAGRGPTARRAHGDTRGSWWHMWNTTLKYLIH